MDFSFGYPMGTAFAKCTGGQQQPSAPPPPPPPFPIIPQEAAAVAEIIKDEDDAQQICAVADEPLVQSPAEADTQSTPTLDDEGEGDQPPQMSSAVDIEGPPSDKPVSSIYWMSSRVSQLSAN